MALKGPIAFAVAALLSGGIAACAGHPAESDRGTVDGRALAVPPPAAQATFDRHAPAGVPADAVEQERENGLATWSAEYPTAAGTVEITVLADGTLVSVEQESSLAAAPAALRKHAAALLGAEAESFDRLRLAVYELEDRTPSGKVRERYVDPFGRVVLERVLEPGADTETPVSLPDLPAAVRGTMKDVAGDQPLSDVHSESLEGRRVYAASWRAADGAHEAAVLDDGTLLSLELPTGPVPPRVAVLADAGAAGAGRNGQDEQGKEADEARRNERAGVERMLLEVWEAEASLGNTARQVLLLPTGQVLGGVSSEPGSDADAD